VNRPIFTEAERQRQARKLSDALNECIREAFRPIGRDRLAYETDRTRPADEIDDLVADLRRVETENSNRPPRL
jgi:hypothetical protein